MAIIKKLKQFFGTPTKAAISIICIVAALAIIGTGTVFAATAITKSSSERKEDARNFAITEEEMSTKAMAQITLEEAKETALTNAELTISEVTFTKTKLESDDGILVYDIEFFAGNTEYEYEINGNTGAIYSKSRETFVVQQPQQDDSGREKEVYENSNGNPSGSFEHTSSDIGVDQAKSIAVSHAGLLLSEVQFSKAKLEKEHGNMIYEIEFYKDGMEYEYEIDAVTGEIIEFDSEWDD